MPNWYHHGILMFSWENPEWYHSIVPVFFMKTNYNNYAAWPWFKSLTLKADYRYL